MMTEATIKHERVPSWWFIMTTMLIAVFLTVIPVPDSVQHYWPDWITLIVFYWVLVLPAHLGVMFGWINGLIEDIVTFSLLGEHALGKALVGTVAAIGYRKFQLFNFVEKTFLILVLQSINIAISAWTNQLAFGIPVELVFWKSALTTALMWLPVAFLLNHLDPNRN